MKRRQFLKTAGAVTALTLGGGLACSAKKDRPNILWITCEDISPHLGCYGDPNGLTPNLDKFSKRAIKYDNAFASAPVCTPARSTIITGVYATSLGTQHLRGNQPLSVNIKCFSEYVREQNYYCTNNVKEDYNFKTPATAWDESSDSAHWRNRPDGKPFFAIFNFMTTHQSQTRYGLDELAEKNKTIKPELQHAPQKVTLPPYYPDTQKVRTNVTALHTQITLMDQQFQDILNQLEKDGLSEDTIVFFYSDHGDGLPRGKRWLHDTGIKVPMLVHFPEKYKHLAPQANGTVTDRLVNFVDLAPTVLSLLGFQPKSYMQGKPFLGKYITPEPKETYFIRDRIDEVLELSRAIRTKKYKYIRNFYPNRPRMQFSFYSEITPIRKELRKLDKQGKLQGHEKWLMEKSVPVDELYDLENDPYEFNNLAESPEHPNTLHELKNKLFNWIIKSNDTAFIPEADMVQLSNGKMPYDAVRANADYDITKTLALADLTGRGEAYIPELTKALGGKFVATKFWGAHGLAVLGKKAKPATDSIKKGLKDESFAVRLTCAEALCNLNQDKLALPVIINALEQDNVYVKLNAAQTLLVIGKKAKPAIPEIKKAIKNLEGLIDHGWYAREVLMHIVENLT